MRALLRGWLVLACLVVGPHVAAAQELVRGQVVDGVTSAAVEGAMAVLLADDEPVAMQLTGPDGSYRLRPSGPGRYRVRVDRIGYGSTHTDPFDLSEGEILDLDIRVAVRAVVLRGLDVEGNARCRAAPDGGATAMVWEEARKALAAATWTSDRELYRFAWRRWVRELDADARRVRRERRTERRGFSAQPFVSREATLLSRDGFVGGENGTSMFYAPDAHVLLSDAFLNDHCFALREKTEDGRSFVGLRFEPVAGRRLPDVEGVLWLDLDTGRLTSLEFTYVNHRDLPVTGRDASGTLSFRELPNGTWIVDEWALSLPRLAQVRDLEGFPLRYEVRGYVEEGGSVAEILTAAGDAVHTVRRPLRGIVVDGAGTPVEGARVRLDARGVEARTGPGGAFTFEDVAEGRWALTLSDPSLERYGLVPPPVELAVRHDDRYVARLTLPSPAAVARARCGGAYPDTQGRAIVVGRLIGPDDVAAADAEIRASWVESTTSRRRIVDGVLARSDGAGNFLICDLPPDADVTLSVDAGPGGVGERVVSWPRVQAASGQAGGAAFAVIDVTLAREQGPRPGSEVPSSATPPTSLPAAQARWLDSLGFASRAQSALWSAEAPGALLARAPSFTALLQAIPGLEVRARARGRTEVRLRVPTTSSPAAEEPCAAALYFNGSAVRLRSGTELVSLDWLVEPRAVTALEVHEGASAPVDLPDACGSVLVWSWDERHADDPPFVGTVAGRVVGIEGLTDRAGDLRVVLRPEVPAGRPADVRTATSSPDGDFRFEGIPPGPWMLEVEVGGVGTWTTRVDVKAGALVDASLTVGPG